MKNHIQAGRISLAIPILLLSIIAGGFMLRSILAVPELPMHATVLPSPAPLPEFVLADQDGVAFGRDSFEGHWSMVFFGYTNCPDICPLTLQQLSVARRRMAQADPDFSIPDIVFVSVDPTRDSQEILLQYVRAFGEDMIGISGDPAEISKLAQTFGVFFSVNPGENEEYAVQHSAAIIIVNDDAEFHAVFSAPHAIEAFVNDMPLIIAAK